MSHDTISRSFCVYKITDSITNKVYIGLTTRGLKRRWQYHLAAVNHGSSTVLHNAIRKHGIENFSIEVIEECPDFETMIAREIYWIQECNSLRPNGYNITSGGEGSLGLKPTEEQCKKMSAKRKGHPVSSETRARISKSNTGKYVPPMELRKKRIGRKPRLTNEQAAIAKFDAYNLMHREYADLFGVSRATIGLIVTGDTYQYITRDHLPLSLYRQQSLWDIDASKENPDRDSKGRYLPGDAAWKTKQRNNKGQFVPHEERR